MVGHLSDSRVGSCPNGMRCGRATDGDHFHVAAEAAFGAEVEHFLGLGGPADGGDV
jgi:hypothetical protein